MFSKPRLSGHSVLLPEERHLRVLGAVRIYADCAAPCESVYAALQACSMLGVWRYSFAVVDASGAAFDESYGSTTQGLGPGCEWLWWDGK